MADGLFYNDLKPPFIISDIAAVTLLTTDLPLYGVSNCPAMGKDFWWAGKKIMIRLFGRITTALTPGTGTLSVYYGTGAAANGVILAATAAVTLIASQTNLSWDARIFVHCRSIGSTGTLFCTGDVLYNSAVVAAHHAQIPASAPVVSAACDLTVASNIISVQYKRSGSTVETMQVHDMEVIALN